MQVLKSLLTKKAPAIWSFDDPVPAFSFIYMIIRKGISKIFG